MICGLFSFARSIIVVLVTTWVVAMAAVTTQVQSGREKNPAPDSRQNAQSRSNETQRIQRDAIRRLTKLIDEAMQIDDVAARVRVLARLADLLWKRDETRARDLLQTAWDECRLIPEPAGPDIGSSLACGTVRAEIMRVILAHDPEFAHRLAAPVMQEKSCSFGPRERNTYESARAILLVQVALSLVPNDPVAAASLGRQSLPEGIVFSLPELLSRLKVADVRLADDLTSAALARIASDDINALELVTMGRYLFDDTSSPSSGDQNAESRTQVKAALSVRFLDSALVATHRFVSKLEQNAEAVAPDRDVFSEAAPIRERAASFFSALTELLPSFERYHPTRLLSARALIERLGRWMDPIDRAHMFVFYDNGDTPESLAAEAEAHTELKSKDELYYLATSLADLKGDSDQALSIAAKISNPERRGEMIDSVWMTQIAKAVNGGRYTEAQQLVSKIAKPERRMMEMLLIAAQASQAGHRTQIIPLLDETAAMLLQTYPSPSPEQAEMLMEIAREYVKADIARGFAAIKNAIDAINAAAGRPVDAVTRKRFGRPVTPTDSLSLFGSSLSVFETLARRDYFRALRLAESFDDRALAIVAQLAVVRAALTTP